MAEPAPTWEQIEAAAEDALRQQDIADQNAQPPHVRMKRMGFVNDWIKVHAPELAAAMDTKEHRYDTQTRLSLTARVIATVRAPPPNSTPAMRIREVHRVFGLALPDDPMMDGDWSTDFTDYVRKRIPLPILREAARHEWLDGVWTRVRGGRALREGFSERATVQISNLTTALSVGGPGRRGLGSPMANLLTQFLSGRIDHTPAGQVPQRPMVQRWHPPPPQAAAASSSNRRRGAGDEPPERTYKKGRGAGDNE